MSILNGSEYKSYAKLLPCNGSGVLDFDECMRLLSASPEESDVRGVEREHRPWQDSNSITGTLVDDGELPSTVSRYTDITPASLMKAASEAVELSIPELDAIMLVGCITVFSYVELCRFLSINEFKGELSVIDRSPRPLACCSVFRNAYPDHCHNIRTNFYPVSLVNVHMLEQRLTPDCVITDAVDGFIGKKTEDDKRLDPEILQEEFIDPAFALLGKSGLWLSRLSGKVPMRLASGETIEKLDPALIYGRINRSPRRTCELWRNDKFQDGRNFIEFALRLEQ